VPELPVLLAYASAALATSAVALGVVWHFWPADRRRPTTAHAASSSMPVEHHGVEDDAETSAWLRVAATGPADEWEAMLVEFGQTLELELAAHDERFWSAIGPAWSRLVSDDRTRTCEFQRLSTQEYVRLGGELEVTQGLSVVDAR